MTRDDAHASRRPSASGVTATLLIAALFVAPYFVHTLPGFPAEAASTWRFAVATLLIAAVLTGLEGIDASGLIRRLGFSVSSRDALACLLLLGFGSVVAHLLFARVGEIHAFERVGARPVFSASQVLHQEIVLRALLLGALLRRGHPPLAIALGTAAFFAAAHWFFFGVAAGVWLGAVACTTLFAVGLAGNWLYLGSGHLGFALAVHLAWNLARFSANYRLAGQPIGEAQSFDVVEGSPEVAAAAVALALASGAFAWFRSSRSPSEKLSHTPRLEKERTP